jgi:hypothetical protein
MRPLLLLPPLVVVVVAVALGGVGGKFSCRTVSGCLVIEVCGLRFGCKVKSKYLLT